MYSVNVAKIRGPSLLELGTLGTTMLLQGSSIVVLKRADKKLDGSSLEVHSIRQVALKKLRRNLDLFLSLFVI